MDIVALVEKHAGNFSAAAAEAGLYRATVRKRYLAAGGAKTGAKTEPKPDKLERRESRDAISLDYCGRKIKTPAELLESAEIDLAIWEVAEQTVNTWEVGGKKSAGQGADGRWKGETLWAMPLTQIKVRLRRRAPKPIQEGIRALLAGVKPVKLPAPKRLADAGHMLEVSLYDAHLGKLCWGKQTGTPYDLAIAAADYTQAVDDLLERAKGFKVGRVLLPIGNDFFQVNNWLGTTARGTVVDAVDDRFQKVFRVGCQAVENAVRRLREVAPVEIVWIPGNHDPETSWYLVEWLAAIFRGDKYTTVDNSPPQRKYRTHGPALIGLTHGNDIKLDRLPLVMATEVPKDWARCSQRHWHIGHFHKSAETRHTAGDTINGVSVTILPSLSGTDAWHYEQGWVENERRAEAHLWGETDGYVGHLSVLARSAKRKGAA